ncbi:MAG TPA: TIGR03088 family PEP-CTERM/XrtA system glycosyltransferase [Casimicrobiaceae bacterium]|nr:TIGR03088 family PEP-CTERM/XrtA system glycosyltransferase [Casimicrobiaceae bacterium]
MSTRRPRIVHVIHRLAIGGLENGVVNLVNRLPLEWSHTIISLTDIDPVFARRIARHDVELVALEKGGGHAVPKYPQVFRLLRALRPAIVHTRNLAALEIAPVAWAAGVPVRLHGEHGVSSADPDGKNPRWRRIRRLYRPFVSHYVAVSSGLASYLEVAIGVPSERVDEIGNGVDTKRFAPGARRTPIAGCPFTGASLRLLGAVGRMDRVKDHANLAHAFVELLRRRPELRERVRLIIVGDGDERATVERILDAADARDLAWLPGERADIPDVLRGLDLFVLPSFGEGLSNTILEAMASGLPVVATQVGANAELIVDGSTGGIVPRAEPIALAGAIERYVDDDAAARAHGSNGRVRAEQRYSLERMVERYHRLYLALASRSPVPAVAHDSRHAPH